MANTFKDYLEQSSLFSFETTSGQIIPQTGEVLSAVKSLMSDVFDQKLDVSDETPAGRLAEMYAVAIKRFCGVTATYANQINPYYATGQMLDAIGSLFAITRQGASATVISVVTTGTAGTVIPAGAIIGDKKGNRFEIQTGTGADGIPAGGTFSTTAVCTETGNISIENDTVHEILSSVTGWSAVTNTGIFSYGQEIETDDHFRVRILNARWTGTAFTEAIKGAIERLDNIDTVIVVDNCEASAMYLKEDMTQSSTAPESGSYIKLNPHSICVIVYGKNMSSADHAKIAKAIYSTKSAGCGYTALDAATQGSAKGTKITQVVLDDQNGASYNVTFNTPVVVSFGVNISVKKGKFNGTDTELIAAVKNAISAWANGEAPFVDGLNLGQSVYSFEIGAAVSDVIPSIQIASVTITIGGQSYYSRNMFVNEVGSLNQAAVNVTIL